MVSGQEAKEEIKSAADIVELIGQFVQLKKAGRNYVGLCPFHAEKDPSFTVNRERQTFHCFGCKKGGDIFSFWMEYHSSTFPEALRDLAEKYNITISGGFSASAEKEKVAMRNALFEINERAAIYFQESLTHAEKGESARAYLKQRSLGEKTISEFRIGYAPDEWSSLTEYLREHHLDLRLAVKAGLIIPKKTGGFYDRFRDRIIFPIFDLRQKVVGFGGRILDNTLPKYLNTPETPIFHKGEFLYGLQASFNAIRLKGRAVIVEGYMDYLALKDHGLEEIVATLGTALTDRHVRKIKGYAKEAVVVFDSDNAGTSAALKSLPVFSNEGLTARCVVLPQGQDPDSFVNTNGLDDFINLLDHASPMFDFFLEQRLKEDDSNEGKVRVLEELLPILSEVRNYPMRLLYIRNLSERTNIREEAVLAELEKLNKRQSKAADRRGIKERLDDSKAERGFISDQHFLNIIIHYPDAVERLMNCEWKVLLNSAVIIEIVDAFFKKVKRDGRFQLADLTEDFKSESACAHFQEALLLPPFVSKEEVELAVCDFEERIRQIKISESIKKVKEPGNINLESLNQLLKLKAEKETGR